MSYSGELDDNCAAGRVTGAVMSGERTTIRFAGEFDMGCAHLVLDTGLAHLQPGLKALALDMNDVTLLDSSSVSAIVRLWKRATTLGVELELLVRHPIVVSVTRLAGLSTFMTIVAA